MDCVRDILDSPVFQSMDRFMQHGDTTCKAHCIKVSYMSYCICKRLGWDHKEVARAGLLHDFFLYDSSSFVFSIVGCLPSVKVNCKVKL